MLTAQQALAKAEATASYTPRMCDSFVAMLYGYGSSGYPTALSHWYSSAQRHPGDMNAPEGALMFWGGGSGHVAISDGQGSIYSTDMPTLGKVGKVPATYISSVWGKPYLGWAQPEFQGAVGATPPVSGVTPVGLTDFTGIGQAVSTGVSAFLAPAFQYILWTGETLIGISLMVAGLISLRVALLK